MSEARHLTEFGFVKLQEFFAAVHLLTSERRLSRFVYLAQKQAAP